MGPLKSKLLNSTLPRCCLFEPVDKVDKILKCYHSKEQYFPFVLFVVLLLVALPFAKKG